MTDYVIESNRFKALCNPVRLQILDMLSCGEICACEILEKLTITQPTLSHHMKVLIANDLVASRKEATWIYYTLNLESFSRLQEILNTLTKPKDYCICHQTHEEHEQ
jgi:ArsR family transcriptional regulator